MNQSSDSSPDPQSNDDDVLIKQLMQSTHEEYLPDEGFTMRVAARLPRPWFRNSNRRTALVATGVLLGSTVVVFSGGQDLLRTIHTGAHWLDQPLFQSSLSVGVLVLLLLCAGLCYATWRQVVR